MELADERDLLLDSSACIQARSYLTNPRKRLFAEIAWLPGLSPKRSTEVLQLLESTGEDLDMNNCAFFSDTLGLGKTTPTARTNLLAAWLSRLPDYSPDEVAEGILEIAWAFEDINREALCTTINDERIVAGFPEITDLSAVEVEIQNLRRYYRQVIESALDNLPTNELVEAVDEVVESATHNGDDHGPILIDDLVGWYQLRVQEPLNKDEGNIKALVEKLRTSADGELPDSTLAPIINELNRVVKNWDKVAQPIQVNTKSQGLDHNASHQVADLVRGLAIHLYNEHGKLDFSRQLTGMLQEVFAEVVEVAERTAEDKSALDDIAEQIDDEKKRAEEWRKEITYEADIGTLFKQKLRISPEGIEWKGCQWDLDSITRVRWGGTRHSVNGIPTGTIYNVIFGDDSDYASIRLKKEAIYSDFIDCLWRAVCVRLFSEYLNYLRDGGKIRFGSAVVTDHGLELERKRLFSSNELVFCRWCEIVMWNHAGVFYTGKKGDKKLAAAFSYQEDDNIHILEAMIRMLQKQGGNRLSSILGNNSV